MTPPTLPEPHWAQNYRGLLPEGAYSADQMLAFWGSWATGRDGGSGGDRGEQVSAATYDCRSCPRCRESQTRIDFGEKFAPGESFGVTNIRRFEGSNETKAPTLRRGPGQSR